MVELSERLLSTLVYLYFKDSFELDLKVKIGFTF